MFNMLFKPLNQRRQETLCNHIGRGARPCRNASEARHIW